MTEKPELGWHILTPEFPPQTGGVSDYTAIFARGMIEQRMPVHVWCPALKAKDERANAWLSPLEQGFTRNGLKELEQRLGQIPGNKRLLLQWVPHGFGYQSMNVWLCWWLLKRSWQGDVVEIMLHEPYLRFREGSWRQDAVAVVHRIMTMLLMQSTRRVWMSTPAWEPLLKPYALGRRVHFEWLPIPSTIPMVASEQEGQQTKANVCRGGELVVGHFGTYNKTMNPELLATLPPLLKRNPSLQALLMGKGSVEFRQSLSETHPELSSRIVATGILDSKTLSAHIRACDVMLQPYPDGINARRTSLLVALCHGVATVGTTGEATEEFWLRSNAVALCPARDHESFVKTTEQLLSDRAGIAAQARRGASFYADCFRLDHSLALFGRDGRAAG